VKVGGLFSGIGGIELGLERAGMQIVWHCEADEFCQHVLAERWPGHPVYPDVRELRAVDVEPVDVLCGGFPCQDISQAGRGAGIDGARSGLWSEYARLVGELRPRYVVVENVAALLARGLERVLGDLAALGYDAEWDCVPAAAFGAPHLRDRVWLVAYPAGGGGQWRGPGPGAPEGGRALGVPARSGQGAAEADPRRAGDDALRRRHGAQDEPVRPGRDGTVDVSGWLVEPDVGRVAHGVPARVDRLRSLGNAVVPQIPEWLGRRILDHESSNRLDVAA
jgi:DNA (cytosine-5)-methyltransferase 1